MRRPLALLILLIVTVSLLLAAAVGAGAPNPAAFINAYDRGLFSLYVKAPTNNVTTLAGGSGALVQEFPSTANTNVNYALIEPNPSAPVSQFDTLQVYSDIYTFFTSIGASTAGVPTIDTTSCGSNSVGTCDYQLFSKDYALFVYSAPSIQSFSVADPFYTRWTTGGGIGGSFSVPASAQTAVTSFSKTAGTLQTFAGGDIFSYPAGSTTPTVFGIIAPVITAYNGAGGYATLGFPTSEAFQVDSTGLMRQTFENGRIEWTGNNTPNVLFPVGEVDITYANQGLTLAPGATATLTANTLDNRGLPVTGRVLTWSTTNGAVATVMGNGYTAVVTAVGAGSANIYVTSEGQTSAPIVVTVGSGTCCAVGQGAPTAAITQAFQTAIGRNQISVMLPAAAPVTRVGNGYIQTFTSADGAGTIYVIAQADGSATAWLLTGALYSAYLANGGFTGALGYPVSDPLAGGIQKFASGAILAGSPVFVIPVPVAARWLTLTTTAGSPVAAAVAFSSYTGLTGISQAFANGSLFGITSGSLSGSAFFSTSLILSRYLALSGPAGALGAPVNDVHANGAAQIENFEGGYIDLQPGAAAAVEHYNPRVPTLSAVPATVVPGGTVQISASGFAPGATLGFTITGQPAFSVPTVAGAFQWSIVIPAAAKPATIAIQATAQGTTSSASGTYTIAPAAALLPTLTIVSGNLQTGLPGSSLAAPIVVTLRDSTGNAIAGAPVSATGSPGAVAQVAAATDQNGNASVQFRLPPSPGVAVGSVSAGGFAVNFSALAAAGSLQNFPAFTQSGQQTPQMVGLSALLAYSQSVGVIGSPNGAATAASLSQFLIANNGFVLSETGASIPNPWIAARFANTGISLENPTADHIRDLLNAGFPALVNLVLTVDGQAGGFTSVNAIGVNTDGSIVIADPNPAYARQSLSDYLNGFTSQNHMVSGKLGSLVRFAAEPPPTGVAPQPAGAAPFTLASQLSAAAAVNSPAGACLSVDMGARFHYCDGTQALYEADFTSSQSAILVDLSAAPARIAVPLANNWTISRNKGTLTAAPASIAVTAVTDAAAFGPAISPGTLISIFGTGFTGNPAVTLGGQAIQVLASFPFQINAVIPVNVPAAGSTLQVSAPLGSASLAVTLSADSPEIFQIGSLGAILNPDATLNTPANPVSRGQFISVYCTGLGATPVPKVTLLVNGTVVQTSYAGAVAGFAGLYQINATIPANLPPGLNGTAAIQEGSQTSNPVPLAIQ